MYWPKNKSGYFWNERPIMVHNLLMEVFSELSDKPTDIEELKIWLLRQKQTQSWDNPISTVDAVNSLLTYGSNWVSNPSQATIQWGATTLDMKDQEAGTGYIKKTLQEKKVDPALSKVSVSLKGGGGMGWGALYWHFNQKIQDAQKSGSGMSIDKKLFVEQIQGKQKTWIPIDKKALKTGDKVMTRLQVTVSRDMEYVALKDLRPACLEPVSQLSGYQYKEGLGYFLSHKDASTWFFFSRMAKGTYVFEYETWVNNAGAFSAGYATIQCLYAPEFTAHSSGTSMVVESK